MAGHPLQSGVCACTTQVIPGLGVLVAIMAFVYHMMNVTLQHDLFELWLATGATVGALSYDKGGWRPMKEHLSVFAACSCLLELACHWRQFHNLSPLQPLP